MKYEHIVNRLIAADDLHYDPQQGRFCALSQNELDRIITTCLDRGLSDFDTITKIVQWCGYVQIGELLRKSFMSGRVKIVAIGNDGPFFAPAENTH